MGPGQPYANQEPVIQRADLCVTINSAGFGYALMANLLFDEEKYSHPLCLALGPYDQDADKHLAVVARCLVRKQGGTDGYVERVVLSGDLVRGARSEPENHSKHFRRTK